MLIHTREMPPHLVQPLSFAEPAPPPLPGVYRQPPLRPCRRLRADPHVLLRQWLHASLRQDHQATFHALDRLEQAFSPLIHWALDSWDYLVTTEGCRFLPRARHDQSCMHGDYRVCELTDYHRLVIRTFRACLADFADQHPDHTLMPYLRGAFWPAVQQRYRALNQPHDHRQRLLTGYSYLRCTPYQFLNAYHHRLVHRTVQRLPQHERRVVNDYFLRFFTEAATAQSHHMHLIMCQRAKQRALQHLARNHTLCYTLLLQIERY